MSFKTIKQVRGYSLIELMITMVIGLFLMGGLIVLLIGGRKSMETQSYTADMQENARFAMYLLAHDVRTAGYYGCSNDLANSLSGVLEPTTGPISGLDGGNDARTGGLCDHVRGHGGHHHHGEPGPGQ